MNRALLTGLGIVHPEDQTALEHVTLHPQLRILPPKPQQLLPLVLGQNIVASLGPTGRAHPVRQRPRVDPQILRDLRDRLASLLDQPHRTLTEILIEPPIIPSHRLPPSK